MILGREIGKRNIKPKSLSQYNLKRKRLITSIRLFSRVIDRTREKEWINLPSESDTSSSINYNNVTNVFTCKKVTYDGIDVASQHLAQLCDKAIDTEDGQIEIIRKKFYVGVSIGGISDGKFGEKRPG